MAELRERIQAEMENVEEALAKLPEATQLPSLSLLELAGAGALLHSFYNGIENILKQMVRARGLAVPTGETWHRDLIETACCASIISAGIRDSLKEYLAFRHFFSHAYAFHVEPERLEPLVVRAGEAYAALKLELRPVLDTEGDSEEPDPD